MEKRGIVVVLIGLAAVSRVLSAVDETPMLKRLLPAEVAGWRADPAADKAFTRDTIFTYMDGAGELYLAYAFRGLEVREYADGRGGTIAVELYDMGKPSDAYGIFTQDLDGDPAAVGREGLYGAGLLRFWKGRFFVRILADRETEETKRVVLGLGVLAAARLSDEGERPRLVAALPAAGLEAGSVRYFHRQVSLNSHYYLADDNVLGLGETTDAVLGTYRLPRGKAMLLLCKYGRAADARQAYLRLCEGFFSEPCRRKDEQHVEQLESGETAGVKRHGFFLVLVLEAPDVAACEGLLLAAQKTIQEVFR
ncbi:MAG: hypothetical protein OEW05_01255 [Candidatus Aminicenantes bacterium]|nr:hypothetical protein [Candidatus Aminicenantes bacterium]